MLFEPLEDINDCRKRKTRGENFTISTSEVRVGAASCEDALVEIKQNSNTYDLSDIIIA